MSAFWMCKHGLLKISETKKMHISVREVKLSLSIHGEFNVNCTPPPPPPSKVFRDIYLGTPNI